MKTTIIISGKERQISAGLIEGKKLYDITDCGEQRLYLNREDKIDIPVMPDDFIIIHGGESFVLGKSGEIEDNPKLRNLVCPEFNGEKGKITLPQAKILAKELKAKDDKFPEGRLFADFKESVDAEISDNMRLIVQDKDSFFVIPPSENDSDGVDTEECTKHGRRPPKTKHYRIRIDGEKYNADAMVLTGAAILAFAGKNSMEWGLNQKFKGGKRESIKEDETVNLSKPGVERFETIKRAAQQGNGR